MSWFQPDLWCIGNPTSLQWKTDGEAKTQGGEKRKENNMHNNYLKLHWAILCSVKRIEEIMGIHASIWKTQRALLSTTVHSLYSNTVSNTHNLVFFQDKNKLYTIARYSMS